MVTYDKLKHAKVKSLDSILTREKDGRQLAKRELILTLPKRFVEKGLVVTHETYLEVAAMCGIIDVETGTIYVLNSPIRFKCKPTSQRFVNYRDMKYLELVFEKGSVVLDNTDLLVTSEMIPPILDIILWQATIPFYFKDEHLRSLVTRMGEFGKLNIDSNPQVVEVLVSLTKRDKNTLKLARHIPTLKDDDVLYKGLANRAFSTDHPFRLLLGGHESKAQKVMVTKEPTATTILEDALRR